MKNRILSVILLLFMIFSITSEFSLVHANAVDSITVGYGLGKDGVMKDGESIKDDYGTGVDGLATNILQEYRGAIVGISGVVSLTFLIFFLINLAKIGSSAGNPQMRQQAIMAVIWCGIACAGVGAIGIFFGFFYNAQIIS